MVFRYRYHARVRTPNGVGMVQGRHISETGEVKVLVTHLPDQLLPSTLAAAIEDKQFHHGMVYKFYPLGVLTNG